MKTSSNYGLKLPEGTDNVKRQDFVDNFTKIDVTMKSIADSSFPLVNATGTNDYTGTNADIKSLNKGTKFTLFVDTDATGNCTLNLNSYGAKNIKDSFGNIVTNFKKDIPYNICFNGVDFILQGKGGGGNANPNQVLAGKTFTNDSGQQTGTMPERGNVTANLNAGQSYTIPEGHHGGGGKITANSLASQTQGTAQAGHILSGKDAYVNGKKVTGNMPNRGRHQVALNQYMYTHTDGKTYLVNWIPGGYCEGWQNSNGTLCTESWIEQSKVASALGITPNKIVSGQEIAGIWGSATAQNLLKYASGTINGEQTINFGFNILVVYIGDPNCFDLPLRTSSSFAAYVNFNGTLLRGGEAGAYTSGGRAYVDYTMPITVSGTSITCTASKYYSRNYYVIGY